MNVLRASLIGGMMAALVLAGPVSAAPPVAPDFVRQAVEVDVTPARLTVYPLGTARVQIVMTNPTGSEQAFALEILLVRPDGSIATAFLGDPISLAPGVTTTAIYAIRHADGAVEAIVTPRSWPYLSN